jgi:hypothetical protein
MTPSGIEPVTCWFVALCLNYYAIAHSTLKYKVVKYNDIFRNGERGNSIRNLTVDV